MKDQAVLNYISRLTYNYWSKHKPKYSQKSPDGREYFYIAKKIECFQINDKVNLFREKGDSLSGQVNPSWYITKSKDRQYRGCKGCEVFHQALQI